MMVPGGILNCETGLSPLQLGPLVPFMTSFSDQHHPTDVSPRLLSISGFSSENVLALMTGPLPGLSVHLAHFASPPGSKFPKDGEFFVSNSMPDTEGTYYVLEAELTDKWHRILALSRLMFSDLGTEGLSRRWLHPQHVWARFEKSSMQHSLLSPQVSSVPMRPHTDTGSESPEMLVEKVVVQK